MSNGDFPDEPALRDRISWLRSGATIWIGTLDGAVLAGIVTERVRGIFTTITPSCRDLGNHTTLAGAKAALEEHHHNSGAFSKQQDAMFEQPAAMPRGPDA